MSGKTTKNRVDGRLVLASTSRYRQGAARAAAACRSRSRRRTSTNARCPARRPRRLRAGSPRPRRAPSPPRYPDGARHRLGPGGRCDGVAISKPGDHAVAVAQLRALSGRAIVFHTAVALVDARERARASTRLVDVRSTFRTLSPAAIEHYLRRETAVRLRRRRQVRSARHRAVRAHRKRRSDRTDRPAADRAHRHAARRRRRRAR